MRRLAIPAAIIAAIATGVASAAPNTFEPPVFTLHLLKFDAYREACGLGCILRNRSTRDILASVSSFMGLNPTDVRLALNLTVPEAEQHDESTFYTLQIPAGEAYCSSRIGVTSILSASGDPRRASKIWVNIEKSRVWVETWTGSPRPGEGQSSVEGTLQVYTVKPQDLAALQAKGLCNAPPEVGKRELLHCQGNPCSARQDTPLDRAGSILTSLRGF